MDVKEIEDQKADSCDQMRIIIQQMCELKTEEAIRIGVVKLTKNIIEIAELNMQLNQNDIDSGDILWLVSDAADI